MVYVDKETLKKSQEYLKNGGSLENLQSMSNSMMMGSTLQGQQIPSFQNNINGLGGFGGIGANPLLANNWNSIFTNPLFQAQVSQTSD
jgi:hypothetical protein